MKSRRSRQRRRRIIPSTEYANDKLALMTTKALTLYTENHNNDLIALKAIIGTGKNGTITVNDIKKALAL